MADTDRIAQMAREAGFDPFDMKESPRAALTNFARFARLVAEDCAKVCEARISPQRIRQLGVDGWPVDEIRALTVGVEGDAEAIRARYK